MSDRLFKGYQRTNNVRLPDEVVKLDTKTAIGAAATASVIKAMKTGDFSNVGNVLQVHDSVTTEGSSNEPTIIGKEEVYVMNDGTNDHEVTSAKAMETLMANGMTLARTFSREITA